LADEPAREVTLVALACAGDDHAFGELVGRRQASIRGLLRRWCGDAALADELAQETFIRAWRNLRRLRSPGAFGGWLRQIALNIWLQHARRAKIPMDVALVEEEVRDTVTPNPGARIDLDRALAALRPPERLCVELSHGQGMSHGEIAAATGLALGTVKSHIARTAKLRALLKSD
jgi:RNA polymerase sigma-70 factor (ECF subfamily)